jgi:hypothetical protein
MKGTFTRTYGVKVPFMRSGMEQGFPTCRVGGYRWAVIGGRLSGGLSVGVIGGGYRWALSVGGYWSALLVGDHLGRGRTVP